MHKKILSAVVIAALSLSTIVASHAAQLKTPEGLWELQFRDSHFEVELCDGDKLCATLVWLSEGSSTPDKTVYLNKPLIDRATRVADRSWRGQFNLFGQTAKGKVTQISDDVIDLQGCIYGVLCQTYKLYRID